MHMGGYIYENWEYYLVVDIFDDGYMAYGI